VRQIALQIEVERQIGDVWGLLADHERMAEWMPVREVVRRHPGGSGGNGVGAVRTIRTVESVVEEEITIFEPPELIEYVLKEGAPVRNYTGRVRLAALGETRAEIAWSVRFQPRLPGIGWLVERALRRRLETGLDNLKRLLEASA